MPTILVVDDHEEIREALAEILEEEGHKILQAADGLQALEVVASSRPDVILLDIAMPGMDGLETLRRLKDQPESSNLPVIMVTAQGDRQNMVKAVQLGVRDYVTKPWEPGEVEMCVNWALKAASVVPNQDPPLLAQSA
ncbi:response regulator [Candidatus Lucifugimonas marina]|jgi:CheY-like chemotaxis protein|uniref:Response regulator n=1 Tax=Candidatus Lucifugimonas marina TaxID=3038979 RepID=A0AAJ5ZIH7_9CHLR|nr:response regulator [SAR202 cluster bacterium JH702]MDG0868784.1 response regulator [SAR202 cluster bacterium JH639]WFG35415.1 response regulator [SAR202 cluster bacterium JH545]WFG39362.1 response regulator [SAR202 cluster bacterium JH1073]